MKQIFNWTVGSFFRTIGRIACYLIIGGILAYFVSDGFTKGNIRITDLLGIQKVSASSFLTADVDYYHNGIMWSATGQPGNYQGFSQLYSNYYNVQYADFDINNNSGITIPNGTNYVRFQVYISIKQEKDIYYNQDNLGQPYFILENPSGYITYLLQTNGAWVNCSITQPISSNNSSGIYDLVCPISSNTTQLNKFNVSYTFSSLMGPNMDAGTVSGQTVNISFSRKVVFEIDEQQATTDAINNQTQVIQDSNTTSEANDTVSFFNSYSNESESQLSQVISAPLTLLNNLITGTDTKLCFTLKGKQSCIPSGRIIWGKTSRTTFNVGSLTYHPIWFGSGDNITNGITAFVALFNLVVGGFLAYKMLLSLYRMVDDMLNPTNNRIEVLKL